MTCCPQLEEPQLENLYFIGLFELLCIHFVKGSISHKLNVNWYDLCLSLEHGLLSCSKLFVMWMEVWIPWLVNWLYRILRLLWHLVHFFVTLCVSYAFLMHMVPLQFVMQYKSTSGQSDTWWWHSNKKIDQGTVWPVDMVAIVCVMIKQALGRLYHPDYHKIVKLWGGIVAH